jgi:RNA polymerase sigma factor (sigma-70 family)
MSRDTDIENLADKYQFLLRYWRRKYAPNAEADDSISAALLGLVTAYDTYDPGNGCAFSTHLFYHVRKALQLWSGNQRALSTVPLESFPDDSLVFADRAAEPEREITPDEHNAALLVAAKVHGKQGELLMLLLNDTDLTLELAAEAVGIKPSQIRRQYARAVKRARTLVERG